MLAKFRQKQQQIQREMLRTLKQKKSLEHQYIALQEFATDVAGSGKMHSDNLLQEYRKNMTDRSFSDAIARGA